MLVASISDCPLLHICSYIRDGDYPSIKEGKVDQQVVSV